MLLVPEGNSHPNSNQIASHQAHHVNKPTSPSLYPIPYIAVKSLPEYAPDRGLQEYLLFLGFDSSAVLFLLLRFPLPLFGLLFSASFLALLPNHLGPLSILRGLLCSQLLPSSKIIPPL